MFEDVQCSCRQKVEHENISITAEPLCTSALGGEPLTLSDTTTRHDSRLLQTLGGRKTIKCSKFLVYFPTGYEKESWMYREKEKERNRSVTVATAQRQDDSNLYMKSTIFKLSPVEDRWCDSLWCSSFGSIYPENKKSPWCCILGFLWDALFGGGTSSPELITPRECVNRIKLVVFTVKKVKLQLLGRNFPSRIQK